MEAHIDRRQIGASPRHALAMTNGFPGVFSVGSSRVSMPSYCLVPRCMSQQAPTPNVSIVARLIDGNEVSLTVVSTKKCCLYCGGHQNRVAFPV